MGPRLHFFSDLPRRGRHAALSAFWILSAILDADARGLLARADGRFVPESWTAVNFNPSFPYRFAHTVTAAYRRRR